jgi:hypothetical protein
MTTAEQRGWRVGHQGRVRMYYEELRDGAWERIDIAGARRPRREGSAPELNPVSSTR